MVVSGDLTEVSYNHPTLGSGTWFPKAAEDNTFDDGGFRSDDDANGVDGGGNTIRKLNQVRWSLETTVSWNMNSANELEKASQLAASPVEADWTISHANGTVWKGTGAPVGDVKGNGNTGLMQIKISGGGKMKKIQ